MYYYLSFSKSYFQKKIFLLLKILKLDGKLDLNFSREKYIR